MIISQRIQGTPGVTMMCQRRLPTPIQQQRNVPNSAGRGSGRARMLSRGRDMVGENLAMLQISIFGPLDPKGDFLFNSRLKLRPIRLTRMLAVIDDPSQYRYNISECLIRSCLAIAQILGGLTPYRLRCWQSVYLDNAQPPERHL